MPTDRDIERIHALIEKESEFVERVVAEIGKVIVGQRTMVERMLIGLLAKLVRLRGFMIFVFRRRSMSSYEWFML